MKKSYRKIYEIYRNCLKSYKILLEVLKNSKKKFKNRRKYIYIYFCYFEGLI